MPFNGSGTFTSIYSWTQDAANAIDISATRMDAQEADYTANGFGNCLTRDGQGSASANLPMNTNRHTGVGNGAAVDDYLALGQLKNGSILYAGTAGGSADALTGTSSPANTALTNGMMVVVKAAAANATTTPTFVLDSIGSALTITKTGGVALSVGDIVGAGHELLLVYSSTGTRWELLNPAPSSIAKGITISGGTLASPSSGIGQLVSDTTNGLSITGNGATNDFVLFNSALSTVITNPHATRNVTLSGGAALLGAPPSLTGNGQGVLGITSAGGLVIAGQGSVSDFTLENKSGSAVATVATGTTVVNFASTPTIGGVAIPTTTGTRATSTDQAVTNGGTFTFTHSLGKLPDSIRYYLVCQTNDNGYTAGQIIDLSPGNDANFAAIVTTTTIVVQYGSHAGSGFIVYLNGTTGASATLTSANWKMRVIASIVA